MLFRSAPGPNQGQGRGNGQRLPPPPPHRGRLNHVQAEDAEDAPDVVLGMFLLNSVPATVLFDSGATHCFTTQDFVKRSDLKPTSMTTPMLVQTPHSYTHANVSCKNTPIHILGQKFHANLIVLGNNGLDVILGMNWMAKYKGKIDCAR